MNLICKLFRHKTITKGYGNMYGSGKRIVCQRCGDVTKNFERRQNDTMQTGNSQMVNVGDSPVQGELGN